MSWLKDYLYGSKPERTAPVFTTVVRYPHQNKFKSTDNRYFDSLSQAVDSYVRNMRPQDSVGIDDQQTQTRVFIDKDLDIIRYTRTLPDQSTEVQTKKLSEYEPANK